MGPYRVQYHSQDVSLANDLRILSEALGNVPGGGGAGGDAATLKCGPAALASAMPGSDDPLMPGCESSSELTKQHSGSDLDPSDEPPPSTAIVLSENARADGQPQCWGAQIALDNSHCVPGYTRGSKHQKNKFCQACRQCISIPASRIVALDDDEHGEFQNSWAGGLWARHRSGFGYRVVNHTSLCIGPRLLIFSDEAPKRPWAPVPESWVSNGMVHFFVSKGTLVPIATGQGDSPGESEFKRPAANKRQRLTNASSGSKSEQSVKVEPSTCVQQPKVDVSSSSMSIGLSTGAGTETASYCATPSADALLEPESINDGAFMNDVPSLAPMLVMQMPGQAASTVQCPPTTQYEGSTFGSAWSSAMNLQGAAQPRVMGATSPLIGICQSPVLPSSTKVARNGFQVALAPTSFGIAPPVIAPPAPALALPSRASTASNFDASQLESSWFDSCTDTWGGGCGFNSISSYSVDSGSVRPVKANSIDSERQRRLVEWMESASRARQAPFVLPVAASQ